MGVVNCLVCKETKKSISVGKSDYIFTNIHDELTRFLFDHKGKNIIFTNDYDDEILVDKCDSDEYDGD